MQTFYLATYIEMMHQHKEMLPLLQEMLKLGPGYCFLETFQYYSCCSCFALYASWLCDVFSIVLFLLLLLLGSVLHRGHRVLFCVFAT